VLTYEMINMLHNTIHDVEQEYGKSNYSEVARRTGLNWRTVKKYARLTTYPVKHKPSPRPEMLDPYKEKIQAELNKHPYISATRIYEKIQEDGFTGKYSTVTKYLRTIRQKPHKLAVYRYETQPGEQAQVDWGTLCKINIDGKVHNVYVFVMVLGYSRMMYAEITLSQSEQFFLQCHINAFNYFGGIPQKILYDNTKTVIIKKAFDSKQSEWNKTFTDFAAYYGYSYSTHLPYHPWTKGKVERCVGYVQDNFFNGRDFASLDDMKTQLQDWLSKANNRIHGTTKKIPFEELKVELPQLKDITLIQPYSIVITEKRKISADGFISYHGNKYSIPYRYARLDAVLKIKDSTISVFCNGEEICALPILHGTGNTISINDHYSGLINEIMAENQRKKDVPETYLIGFKDLEVETRSCNEYEVSECGGDTQ